MGIETTHIAIADAGPTIHLCQIGQERQFAMFKPLIISDLVRDEMDRHEVLGRLKGVLGDNLRVEVVAEKEIRLARSHSDLPASLSDADVSVCVLAHRYPHAIILTDDLALRRPLERQGFTVVGSIGILFRAYSEG